MRILSLRLIVALIVGVTLVSLASSWYEVQAEKDALRRDLERKAETFGESLAGNASRSCRPETGRDSNGWSSASTTAIMCWESAYTTGLSFLWSSVTI